MPLLPLLDSRRCLLYLKGMTFVEKGCGRAAGQFFLVAVIAVQLTGCSPLRRSVISGAADALSGDRAAEVYTSDDDPALVRDAFPFVLKTTELLIVEDPENRSLYLSAGSGFVQYATLFLDSAADMLEEDDFEKSRAMKKRAARLYYRGCLYSLGGLELDHPDFRKRLREDPEKLLERMGRRDVPLLFWAGAGWMGTIAVDSSNMARLAELSLAEAVMRRVLEVDEDFGDGVVHEFFITFEGGRSETMGGSPERAREHYRRANELSGGRKASPLVALAETVAVREQNIEEFRSLLEKALAVDVNEVLKWRLGNVVAQERARWLLDRVPDLFVDFEEESQ
jgi:predicted anti-sigma-YlaC factor YlaD